MEEESPKWRLEHASNGLATCQRAVCKRENFHIDKGELRIGTHTLFDNGEDRRWYMAWRHWRCATKHQIAGLKGTTEGDPTKAPGYETLSTESQKQVRLAFDEGKPVDKRFKGIREDLAKDARKYGKEYRDAISYQVDVAARAAACRGGECLSKSIKITKGYLRIGIHVPFDGEHTSTMYKHWKCMSAYDLEHAKLHFDDDSLDGIHSIPEEYNDVVLETFKTGKVVEPPEPEIKAPAKSKRPRTKKTKTEESPSLKAEGVEDQPEDVKFQDEDLDSDAAAKPKPKPKPKAKMKGKLRGQKRRVEKVEASSEAEVEYVPKKSKSRSVPFGETVHQTEAV